MILAVDTSQRWHANFQGSDSLFPKQAWQASPTLSSQSERCLTAKRSNHSYAREPLDPRHAGSRSLSGCTAMRLLVPNTALYDHLCVRFYLRSARQITLSPFLHLRRSSVQQSHGRRHNDQSSCIQQRNQRCEQSRNLHSAQVRGSHGCGRCRNPYYGRSLF